MLRVLIFGTGSVGVLYASLLHRAGTDVVCVCRSNYEIAKANGFTIDSTIFGRFSFKPIIVSSVAEAMSLRDEPFDFVLVCTKALPESQSAAAIALAPAMKSSETSLVIIQNGLGVEKSYATLSAHPGAIISAVTYSPTSQVSPGVFAHTEIQRLSIGCYPAKYHSKNLDVLAVTLGKTGANVTICKDIQVERWKKLIGNTTWNPICALSRCRDLQFLSASPLAVQFVRRAMGEVVKVAEALGYGDVITEDAAEVQFQRSAARAWPGVEPSMMADMRSGGKMEVEAIIGQVIQIAIELGVDTPRLEAMYVLLAGLDLAIQSKG